MDNFQRLDIVSLINNNPVSKLSTEFQTNLLHKIQERFTNDQQQLFIASFYTYLNYNSKTDFVIDLDNIWKWLGFSRKEHCKTLLVKHFTNDIDYKCLLPQLREQNNELKESRGGHNKEQVMLNIETFKGLCMLAGTEKSKEIRQYYLKLEELLQNTMKEESEALKLQLEQQNKKIELLENKPHTYGFSSWKNGYVYLVTDISKPGHYKIGMTTNTEKRVRNLNTASSEKSLHLYYEVEVYDTELFERTIHNILQPFNIKGRKEWFYFSNETQLKYAIDLMDKVCLFLNKFNFTTNEKFLEYVNLNNITNKPLPNEVKGETNENIQETNVYKLTGQQTFNKTGTYKGVCFSVEKQKWKAELKLNYNINFLGYYDTELDAAKAYNNYATFLNQNDNTNYTLNEIPDFVPIPINIPTVTKEEILKQKSSKFRGVSFNSQRQYYNSAIKFKNKSYNLCQNVDEIECAKIYNQQSLYFNNHYGTKYKLNDIPDYQTKEKNHIVFDKKKNPFENTSKFYGVSLHKNLNKYRAYIVYNKKQLNLGLFTSDIEAAKAYNEKAKELNDNSNKKYKLNTF
jgi:phage anti-repressor protein